MALEYRTNIVSTTPYMVAKKDEVILVNVAAASKIILPATGDTDDDGARALYIKDISGLAKTNPITITASGGKTIDGVPFALLNGGYSHIQVVYDGTNWLTIA